MELLLILFVVVVVVTLVGHATCLVMAALERAVMLPEEPSRNDPSKRRRGTPCPQCRTAQPMHARTCRSCGGQFDDEEDRELRDLQIARRVLLKLVPFRANEQLGLQRWLSSPLNGGWGRLRSGPSKN